MHKLKNLSYDKGYGHILSDPPNDNFPENRRYTIEKIIVADVPEGIKAIRNVMGSDTDIIEAGAFEQAQALIKMGADLIVCGIHFSDSRMFDLIRLAKANSKTRAIPIICYRNMDSELSPPFFESLQIAYRSQGAIEFIDFFDMKSKYGIEKADRKRRRILLDLLQADGSF